MKGRAPGGRTPAGPFLGPLAAGVCAVLLVSAAAPRAGSTPSAPALPVPLQDEPFPHAAHQGLFPLCEGCHAGIPTGQEAAAFPPSVLCSNCHDGVELDRVPWESRTPPVDNLRFDHAEHVAELARHGEDPLPCGACHLGPDAPRMSVQRAEAEGCLSCHAHAATTHLVDADCATCHVPLAGTRFPLDRIAALPAPADHDARDFLLERHGPMAEAELARCATCHTQERCSSCHVDAGHAAIAALPVAPAGMALPPAEAHYPTPPSHLATAWLDGHGGEARARPASCATCHTRDDCAACHVGAPPGVVAGLPSRAQVRAPGVQLAARTPVSHASAFFGMAHGALASASEGSCATCHTETFCVECHDAPAETAFHPPGFVSRHAAEGWGRRMECSNCHQVQAFCRQCHVEAGLQVRGRLGPGYHDAEPVWLFKHGQAARQNLESCTACHTQPQCLQCHSTLGAFRVSPHGPDFDARRAQQRNAAVCFACHIADPLGRRP